ncbi:MAG: bifunctional DNA-formamidopyrimidine glycosylase/DNA-(apurinic or apyrimidinic site) lyase [Acidobacteriota bacterium]|nr:bifunctional DNA-formamidopyrimidine glycosylase/DNA-(apurinic or apyrimidinic site) lyase [Acidobacteriota bacterium]
MPEMPEVETIARGLEPRIRNRVIGSYEVLRPALLRNTSPADMARVCGEKVLAVRRRGKMLLIDVSGNRSLVFHLKMTGQIALAVKPAPIDKHVHFVLVFKDAGPRLLFRDVRKFGFLCCLETSSADRSPVLGNLGLEPLDAGFQAFCGVFKKRTGRLKSLLLNQRLLAGIGNIYADEILFRARLHPLTAASALKPGDFRRLRDSTREVLSEAVERRGSTIRDYLDSDGRPGDFQDFHRVYGREGEPCAVCGSRVRRIRVGGRSTFFCGRCQRLKKV